MSAGASAAVAAAPEIVLLSEEESAPLRRFYLAEMRPFLEWPKQRGRRLADTAKARAVFSGLRTLLRGFVERGHTMVIVSHAIGFLEGLADQLLYMEGGEIVESGDADQVLHSPRDPRTKDFVEQAR